MTTVVGISDDGAAVVVADVVVVVVVVVVGGGGEDAWQTHAVVSKWRQESQARSRGERRARREKMDRASTKGFTFDGFSCE